MACWRRAAVAKTRASQRPSQPDSFNHGRSICKGLDPTCSGVSGAAQVRSVWGKSVEWCISRMQEAPEINMERPRASISGISDMLLVIQRISMGRLGVSNVWDHGMFSASSSEGTSVSEWKMHAWP